MIPETNQQDSIAIDSSNKNEDEWDDLLGTGTILKQVIVKGARKSLDDDNLEAPRKFFALIDIDIKCNNKLVESHKNYLINSDADLFPGPHLVIPLMDINETSRYIFDPKFCFGEEGLEPGIPSNSKLECIITLKLRSPYDEFLSQMSPAERINLGSRKRDRGKFWYSRSNYSNAITIYQSLAELCQNDEFDGGDHNNLNSENIDK